MADRKASVSLELKAGQFKAEATEVEAKVEGIDRKVKEVDRSITKIPPDAAKAAAAMKLLGDESSKAGVKLDEMGRRSTSLGAIDQEIAKARNEVRLLGEEFNRTGDSSVLSKLFGKQSDLRELDKLRKRVSTALEQGAQDGGQEGAKQFSAALQGGLSTPALGPALVGALVGAVVLAAPLIGAVLEGALVAGIGLGGIGAGIAGQIHDPQVTAAFTELGHEASHWLSEATASFKAPLIDTAKIFAATLDNVGPHLQHDFEQLSMYVRPLAAGIQQLFQNMAPGLDKLFEAAGPVLMEIARELPGFGRVISEAFSELASHADRAKEGIRTIFLLIETGILIVTRFVTVLSDVYHGLLVAGQAVSDFAASLLDWIPGLDKGATAAHRFWETLLHGKDAAGAGTTELRNLGHAANLTADDMDRLNKMLTETTDATSALAAKWVDKLFNEMMGVDQATLRWHESLTSLHDTLAQNGLAIDRHTHLIADSTKAGEENRSAILAAVQANQQQYQAMVAGGIASTDAAKAYDSNTAALEKQLRAAGYTAAQVDDLIGKYRGVPGKVNTALAVQGLTDAINNLGALEAEIHHIDGKKYGFTVTETHNVLFVLGPSSRSASANPDRWGGIYEHAAGGLLSAAVYSPVSPARYAFAEPATGGEAFVPRFGDYGRSTAILDQAARWYGGRFAPAGGGGQVYAPTYHVHVAALDARAAGPVVVEAIKSYERSNGTNWRTGP